MLNTLPKHHIGIVIQENDIKSLEQRIGKKFHLDQTQGVRVIFEYDSHAKLFYEYIVQEGRASKYSLGFNHLCFEIRNKIELEKVHAYIINNKLGFRLTFPEKSGSAECGFVTFYKHRDLGIVEFNILDYENSN